MRGKHRGKTPLKIIFGLLVLTALGFIVMLLWNAILPDVVNAKTINFWQALGLLVLSKILFGGFGNWGHKKRIMHERMHEKWHRMTPEEREKFKEEWRNRCGWKAQWVREQVARMEGNEPEGGENSEKSVSA